MNVVRNLLIATRNAHKTEEIAAMLGALYQVSDLTDLEEAPEVEETGTTFLENAVLKAVVISKVFPGLVLADDSGLEVDALNGAPGVYSARFAGRQGDDAANNKKLLQELSETPAEVRTGRFRCVMVLAEEGRVLADFSGAVEGSLLDEVQGAGGFGYDPLFVPEGYTESFATLSAEVKNTISHRQQALKQVIVWLEERSADGA